jgi:hypothetical protein
LQDTTQTVLFPSLFDKPVVAAFDQPHSSSDGGAILLRGVDESLGLTDAMARVFLDPRQVGKVAHSMRDMLRQRVHLIACGYADCNDADRLAHDPIQKLLLDRDPIDGRSLASQPTLSRFENAATRRDLLMMAHRLAETVVDHHARRLGNRANLITIDLDPTDDPTHGNQQLSLFNGHYDSHCYLPVVGTLTFNDESESYVFAAVLRGGTASATDGAEGILTRIIAKLQLAFGANVPLRVRLDGGYAKPRFLEYLEAKGVEYVVGFPGNSRLDKRIRRLLGRVRMMSKQSGETATLFGETRYATRSWRRKRRIVMKAEVVRYPGREARDNPRYLVTNLKDAPVDVYNVYRLRGDVENRIKELHHGLEMDRTSCMRFLPNQLRVLMTAASFVLMQEIRRLLAGTDCARSQVTTLRERLLKMAAWVTRSARRIVLHLPTSSAWLHAWKHLAMQVGAVGG